MKKTLGLSLLSLLMPTIVLAAESDLSGGEAAMLFAPMMIIWVLWMLFMFLLWAGMIVFAVGGSVLWIFMLIDLAKREFKGKDEKIVWILILVLTGVIGAFIYYFYGRKQGFMPVFSGYKTTK